MILEALEKILQRQDLTAVEASAVMDEILSGDASETRTAAFLVALSMKGESAAELLGMARSLRGKTYLFSQYGPVEVSLSNSERKLLVSTSPPSQESAGAAATFNISSAVAFVVAGAGAHLLQQGYRSGDDSLESSAVLEALGVSTRIPAWKIARGVAEIGVGFVFEPVISEAMKRLAFALRQISVPTALDLLLPLLNPGDAPGMVVGVHSAPMTETIANVVLQLGVRRAFVFHGSDGLDEITNTGSTCMVEVVEGRMQKHNLEPGQFGLPVAKLEELSGGDAARNAEVIRAVLNGEPGARRNAVLLNAAPCIACAGKALDLQEGVRFAAEAIDSGRALKALEMMSSFSQQSS